MVEYRKRSGWSQLAVVLTLLGAGGGTGFLLGRLVAPDWSGSAFVSGAMLPIGVFTGVTLWLGTAVLFVGAQAFKRWRGHSAGAVQPHQYVIPPGSFAFVPSSLASAIAAALVVSLFSIEASFVFTGSLYIGLGLIQGFSAWWLARSGYFPVPDVW